MLVRETVASYYTYLIPNSMSGLLLLPAGLRDMSRASPRQARRC